jgi:hypothetical protein
LFLILAIYTGAFAFRRIVERAGTAVAASAKFGAVVVSICIAVTYVATWRLIINRTAVIVVPASVIAVSQVVVARQPASVYPAIAGTIIFPIARNPIGAGVRSKRPIAVYPNILSIIIIPSPISVDPDVIGTGGYNNRSFNCKHNIRSERNFGINRYACFD